MGDSQTKPQFSAVFELLKPLVFACKPPSASSDTAPSPHQQPPVAQLPALDADMLTCSAFVRRLMDELTSTKMLKTVKPLVEHLCWEDEALTNKFVGAIRDIVKKEEHAAKLKPSFRAMVLLCEVGDSKQAWRCEQVIGGVLEEMQANSQYFRGTETCISLLMRMAKHHDAVRTWLKEHGDAWRWVATWLTDNPEAPEYSASTEEGAAGVQLHKPGQRPQAGAGPSRSATLLPNVERLLSGEDVENDGYDSDDEPDVLVGMRIEVRWQGNKWYQGVVKAYKPDEGEHLVHYDDNDKKWYVMSNKTWRPLAREPFGWQETVDDFLLKAGGMRPGVATRGIDNEIRYLVQDDVVAARKASTARLAAPIDPPAQTGGTGEAPPASGGDPAEEERGMADEDPRASSV